MDYKFQDNRIVIEGGKPKRCKKLTMTRLGTILGLNPWATPFSAWCEITKVYEKPFAETPETKAGKVIEPIVREWLKNDVYESTNIMSPEEFYGNTWGSVSKKYDFYPERKVFGGMWDTVLVKPNNGGIKRIFEQKTTRRVEDWVNGAPLYYVVQGLGYCYMSGVIDLTMTGTFLEEKDYMHPENFVPNESNTMLVDYDTSYKILLPDGMYYTIDECFEIAENWWNTYVETGISPEFDTSSKVDNEIIKALKSKTIDVDDTSVEYLYNDFINQSKKLEEVRQANNIAELEEAVSLAKQKLSEKMKEGMSELDTSIAYRDAKLTKVVSKRVDTDALKKAGLFDSYSKETISYKMNIKEGE